MSLQESPYPKSAIVICTAFDQSDTNYTFCTRYSAKCVIFIWLVKTISNCRLGREAFITKMAESLSTSSETDYFSNSIVEFLDSKEFDDLLAGVDISIEEQHKQPSESFEDSCHGHSDAPPRTGITCSTTEDVESQTLELQRLKDKTKNANTEKSTSNWARVFMNWQSQNGVTISLGEITPTELDNTLQNFYADVKKKDGSDYEPESLRTMLAALDRHFRENGYKHNIAKELQGFKW